MQVTNAPLHDIDGNPIKSGEVDMTVAVVLVNCALAPTPEGKTRTESDIADRWDLALRANKLAVGECIEVPPELMVRLKEDMRRIYSTLVAGQMLPVMNGNAKH